jgi:signal transduction histidine kinase
MSKRKIGTEPAGNYSELRRLSINPLKISIIFSIGYFVVCTIYIWLSSLIAANLSASIADLQQIETIKGIAFIFVTTISIFLILHMLLKRMQKGEKRIIDQQQEIAKSQQEAVAGVFASSIAHDINNIMIILEHYCDLLLRDDFSESRYPETREKVQYAVGELKNLAKRLMNIGRGKLPHEFSKFDLPRLVKDTIKLMQKHRSLYHCSVEYVGLDKLSLIGNESIMRQLLINLILNAAQATLEKGKIEIHVDQSNQNAVIEIHDNGPGISAEERETVFKAFYSTRTGGTGLGLMSVKVYAKIHNGQVAVADSHLGGACFRIQIPLQKEAKEA